ncbi:heme oxygenase-like protein [Amanita muscaria]
MPSLTQHLLSLSTTAPYSAAVNHPYLKAAANGTLNHNLHALWLSQDRIYAMHAYPRFIGALITKINFSSAHTVSSNGERFNQRILTILASSLEAVMKEGQFFINTAQKFNLPLDGWRERKATKDYTAEMCRVSTSMNIEEGLVFLWAMEKVYFDAWSNVNNGLSAVAETNEAKQCVAPFAENWSSPQFAKFVDSLADLVNSLDIKPGSETWYNAERRWNRVVELEVEFWPTEGEEVSQRIA